MMRWGGSRPYTERRAHPRGASLWLQVARDMPAAILVVAGLIAGLSFIYAVVPG